MLFLACLKVPHLRFVRPRARSEGIGLGEKLFMVLRAADAMDGPWMGHGWGRGTGLFKRKENHRQGIARRSNLRIAMRGILTPGPYQMLYVYNA